MRTLFEIAEAAKANEPTTHEECLYAMLAYQALHQFTAQALRRLCEHPNLVHGPLGIAFERSEDFNRHKAALNESPVEYVGWENDPKNPDYQAFRKTALHLYDQATKTQDQP